MTTYSYDSIVDRFTTVEDVHLAATQIDSLLVALYKTDKEAFVHALQNNLHRNLSDSLMQALTDQHISLEDHDALEQYCKGLKHFLSSLPLLQLTLAYHPNNEQIEKLSEWARSQTNKPVILELHYNPYILGGAIITFEGKYLDLSLKKKLDAVYEAKRGEVMGMLT